MSASPFLYDAFATYATKPDGALVRDVEAFLESLDTNRLVESKYRSKLSLCVDGSDFKVPGNRGPAAAKVDDPVFDLITEHMKRARRCIVFVGPKSRLHPWITRELDWWLDNRDPEDLIIALTHGDNPMVDREGTFPPRVLSEGLDKRSWVDLRGWRRRAPRAQAVRPYPEQRLRIAAELIGVAPTDLIASWRAGLHRKRRRDALIAVSITIFIAGLLGKLSFTRDERNHNERLARASSLALVARLGSEASDNRSLDALTYAASSVAVEPTSQGYAALVRSLRLLPTHVWGGVHDETGHAVDAVAFLDSDRVIASSGWSGILHFANASDDAELTRVKLSGRATALLPHRTRPLIAIATQRGVDLVGWERDENGLTARRMGHSDLGRVRGIAFTPDGRHLVVGSFEGTLAELDLDTAALENWQPLRVHALLDADGDKAGINGIAIEPLSGQLVVADILGSVYCLRFADWGAPARSVKHSSEIFAVAQHPTLDKLAIADADGGWLLFNPATCTPESYNVPARGPATTARDATGRLREAPRFERPRTGIAYSTDGTLVGIASHDSTVRILTAANASLLRLMILPTMTRAVAFAADLRHVVTGSDDGRVNMWDIAEGPERWTLGGIDSASAEPKGNWVTAWSDTRRLQLVSAADGSVVDQAKLPDSPSFVEPLSLGENKGWILRIGASTRAPTFSVQPTDVGTRGRLIEGTTIQNPNSPGDVAPILEIHAAGSGTLVATRDAQGSGTVRLRNIRGGKLLFVHNLTDMQALAASGEFVAVGNLQGEVNMFHSLDNTQATLQVPGAVSTLALDREGNRLLVGFSRAEGGGACLCRRRDTRVQQWREKLISSWRGGSAVARFTCGTQTEPFQCKPFDTEGQPAHAAFSRDGRSLALAIDGAGIDSGSLLLLNEADGFNLHVLSRVGRIRDLAFSPDGLWLAAGGMDRAATVYDVTRADAIAMLPFENPIQQVSWMGEGSNLLMTLDGINPGILRLWEWQPKSLIAAACARWPSWFAPPREPLLPQPAMRSELCKQ